MEDKKVNLFVVGAMKAGTTSFVDLLSQHPEIYVPPIKEPHFFIDSLPENLYEPSRFFDLDGYLNKSFPKPLHITKIKSDEQYDKIFSLSGEQKYLVDASTAYLHAPESPSQIYNYNSQSKIIVIIREPISRAHSHYNMDLGLGRVYEKFEDLLNIEIKNYQDGTLLWNSYLGMSFYNSSLARFNNLFDHVLVISFEELVLDQNTLFGKVAEFLGIDEFDMNTITHRNVTRKLRSQKLFYLLKKMGLKDYFSRMFSDDFRQRLFKLLSKSNSKEPKLSEACLKELNQIFKKESI
jgi:hypothetical protein